ncbi:MAG: hypothetical protein AB1Z63_04790 [Candidatus Limnocylindrales bacterium]
MTQPARYAAGMTDYDDDLRTAVHENTSPGWYVGRPMERPERNEWSMYAFDPTETPIVGKRSREWTAVGQTELHCVQTMVYCLTGTKEGRWPK